jgi:hypothetical protein
MRDKSFYGYIEYHHLVLIVQFQLDVDCIWSHEYCAHVKINK